MSSTSGGFAPRSPSGLRAQGGAPDGALSLDSARWVSSFRPLHRSPLEKILRAPTCPSDEICTRT